MTEYSERDLILPALEIISRQPGIATSSLIKELEKKLEPDDEDLEILKNRSDTKFSQKVRNLVSHHTIDQSGLGYVFSIQKGKNWYHTITNVGKEYLDKFLPDEVEGVDLDLGPDEKIEENVVAKEYPVDSVLIRYEQRTVFEVVRRIDAGAFILDPDFQREFIWMENKQSRLIESALMRIPLPVFYLAERDDGKIVVVDGLQRLKTFDRYIKDEFALQLPKTSPSIHGKKFSGLSPRLQQRIEDAQLIIYLIDPKVPERVRLDIFERVNSGIQLTRQQMRNAIHMGPATKWLKQEAQSSEFLKATGNSLNWRTMRDREVINRYCACSFSENIEKDYVGDMDDFLAQTLKKMNKLSPTKLNHMSLAFKKSMVNNLLLFGKHAFRRHKSIGDPRSVINVALFDVLSVQMAHYDTNYIQSHLDDMRQRFYSLMDNENFISSISTSINSLSTNSVTKVRARFALMENAFKDIK